MALTVTMLLWVAAPGRAAAQLDMQTVTAVSNTITAAWRRRLPARSQTKGSNNSAAPAGALSLYPNPASAIINVNMTSSTVNPTYVVKIYNSLGVTMKTETISAAAWTDDVSSYRLGIYILQVNDTNGNILGTAKFAKVN